MQPVRLAQSVGKSVVERSRSAIAALRPLNQWEWILVSQSDKEYRVHLHQGADGWYGYCTCNAFRINANRAKNGAPVPPCKHLVAIKRMHEENPEALRLNDRPLGRQAEAEQKTKQKEVMSPPSIGAENAPTALPPPATAVIPQGGSPLPIEADPQAAAKAIQTFEAIKRAVVNKEDLVRSQGKEYIRRSGFRKIALAYRISTQLLERRWERAGDAVIAYAAYRAVAPNGRFADGEGWCSLDEANVKRLAGSKGMAGKQYHVAAAIAATRAINRAIADLIGGGQVSAEEVDAEYFEEG